MKFVYKIFKECNDTLLAISDSSIVGKKFEEDELILDVSESFYSENSCNEGAILNLIKDATIINAVGEDIVSLMLKENIIDPSKILRIEGIPHVQVIVVK